MLEKLVLDLINDGNIFHSQGRWKEAFICFDQVIELDPHNAHAWIGKGAVLLEQDNFEEALTCVGQGINLDPDNMDAWVGKGHILRAQGKWNESIICFDKILTLDPDNVEAWIDKGSVLCAQRNLEESLTCFQIALTLDPESINAYLGKGVVLWNQSNLEEALTCYEQVLDLDPSLAHAWKCKGYIFTELGNFDEALTCFDQALALQPKLAVALNGKANIFYAKGELERALTCYDQAIAINPNLTEALNGKGCVLHAQGHLEKALICFDQIITINPNIPSMWNNKARVLRAQCRLEEAIICFEKALELNPKLVRGWIDKGYTFLLEKNLESAADCFHQASALKPTNNIYGDSSLFLQGKAFLAYFSDQLSEATSYFQQAESNLTNIALIYRSLFYNLQGQCYFAFHAYDQAEASLEMAATLLPTHTLAQQKLQEVRIARQTQTSFQPPSSVSKNDNPPILAYAKTGFFQSCSNNSPNLVRIRIWDGDPGHVSLETRNIYLSLWPDKEVKIIEALDAIGGNFHTYNQDRVAERRAPDSIYDIELPRAALIDFYFIQKFELFERKKLLWSLTGNTEVLPKGRQFNCCTLVANSLKYGGIENLINESTDKETTGFFSFLSSITNVFNNLSYITQTLYPKGIQSLLIKAHAQKVDDNSPLSRQIKIEKGYQITNIQETLKSINKFKKILKEFFIIIDDFIPSLQKLFDKGELMSVEEAKQDITELMSHFISINEKYLNHKNVGSSYIPSSQIKSMFDKLENTPLVNNFSYVFDKAVKERVFKDFIIKFPFFENMIENVLTICGEASITEKSNINEHTKLLMKNQAINVLFMFYINKLDFIISLSLNEEKKLILRKK